MRIRIIAVVVAGAAALGVFAIVLLTFAYNTAIASPPDDSGSYVAQDVQPAPTETAAPTPAAAPTTVALPTEAEIPADWPESEKQNARNWLAMQAIADTCMADAGFPEYTYAAFWDGVRIDWMSLISEDRQADAFFAEYGNTGAGADYHWEDAGCAGYSTHMIGADNAN